MRAVGKEVWLCSVLILLAFVSAWGQQPDHTPEASPPSYSQPPQATTEPAPARRPAPGNKAETPASVPLPVQRRDLLSPAREEPPENSARALYRRLAAVELDPNRIYKVRDVLLDREDIHLALNDGTIAFTRDVEGRVTGALFEGEGDLLLMPPSQVERTSLELFTGAAVLSERFTVAYFRFTADLFRQLQPAYRPAENAAEFYRRWNPAAASFAQTDALRLLAAFLDSPQPPHEYLHARVIGVTVGTFDLFFDTRRPEQISVAGIGEADGAIWYDIWTSFTMRSRRPQGRRPIAPRVSPQSEVPLRIRSYRVRTDVVPPSDLETEAVLSVEVVESGRRVFPFELSRYLKVSHVETEGRSLDFLQNEALRGSELERQGNDQVVVVFPEPLPQGTRLELRFVYGGSVLSAAGGGLMYVGARGTWYPNQGLDMADFDLEFRYPAEWTLVATGRRVSMEPAGNGLLRAHWVSERPIPTAGFNLGEYVSARARAGDVTVETFAARGVEEALVPPELAGRADLLSLYGPDPSRATDLLARRSAQVVAFLSHNIAPYPYSSLSLTQMPGSYGQGWPGLIFLSSYAFLIAQGDVVQTDEVNQVVLGKLMLAHETAHQWWGDSVIWRSYRDQWLVEALANYCALMLIGEDSPSDVRTLMEHYRHRLLEQGPKGEPYSRAGAVTLGARLSSSQFPDGYRVVSYGRGTWLLHMLRHMLRDAAILQARRQGRKLDDPDALFFQALRTLHRRFEGKAISNREVKQVFEEVLPPSLYFEGRPSLDWFFDGWVNGSALPRYGLDHVRLIRNFGGVIAVGLLEQSNAPDLLVTSVPIYADTGEGDPVLVARLFADGSQTRFRLPVPDGTRRLLLDPYQTILTRP